MSTQNEDQDVTNTVAAVSWDALLVQASTIFKAKSAQWGEVRSGAFNVVRFLHMHDDNDTVLVARVPKLPNDGWTEEEIHMFSRRISSEVATMRYVEAHTKIPVPHVFHHSVSTNGDGVGSPYILMSKIEGVPLSQLWDDMDDDKRAMILRQVVDIYLELFSQRFDHIGSLFMNQDNHEPKWYVDGMVIMPEPESHPTITSVISSTTFRSAFDFWIEYANGRMRKSRIVNFGSTRQQYEYLHMWFIRSLVPSLYDTSLDVTGFPLCPGDFHTQNIMVVGDNDPRISGVIDWECSRTLPTSSVAQYPLIIVDHPHWEPDDPMRERNIRDQATFTKLMHDAEAKADAGTGYPITRAFQSCHGLYLFEQVVQYPLFYNSGLFGELFDYAYGKGSWEDGDFVGVFGDTLLNGALKEVSDIFETETEVFNEAEEVLGEMKVTKGMERAEFEQVIRDHAAQFQTGIVHQWVTNQPRS